MKRFLGILALIPGRIISGIWYFVWPRQSRRRYRTALLAVFLFAFLGFNLDYPKLWNSFADWYNPKLDGIDLPESVRRLDKWYILKYADDVLNVPRFMDTPFSKGLDLEGGIHLIYDADLSQVESGNHKEAMGGLRDVIERRVNLFGVREPNVLVEKGGDGYRLVVELAGITDFSKAIELIGATPFLEFKEERPDDEKVRILRKTLTDETKFQNAELLSACANVNPELIIAITQSQGEDPCFKSTAPPLTGKYLKNASLQFDPNTNQPVVSLELDDTGAKIFEDVTGRNISKPIAIYLDNILINWPRVQEKISGGRAQITGFNIEGAKVLARNLSAGALPVPISLISQQSIGASLGEESLQKSLRAGVVGSIAVALFMIILYRVSGLLAVVALFIYIVLNLAIFKLMPVTLTLPGIAGIILSIGMAVDANILVFERLREEFGNKNKDGVFDKQEFLLALNRAYERAWLSIRDGNFTTLLTGFILFWFSTSFIKGFALTLSIGVLTSMFSAMVVTRYLMRLVGEGRLGKKTWVWIR
jgi:protein-export membrane protein SecD